MIERLITELENGIEMTADLDDATYRCRRDGESPIGAHIRHNLDFVNALLNGIAERQVDYTSRLRDPRVENDREYAIAQLAFACRRLRALDDQLIAHLVVVRSEIDEDVWHTSSLSREIEFLHSHTVHHYALIKQLIEDDIGPAVAKGFGIAPSTLRFREGAVASN